MDRNQRLQARHFRSPDGRKVAEHAQNKLLPCRGRVPKVTVWVARVAQLDRASVSEAEGCGFDPRPAHQFFRRIHPPQAPGRPDHFAEPRTRSSSLAKSSGITGVAPDRVQTKSATRWAMRRISSGG